MKLSKDYNLAKTNPELLCEWDYNKNIIKPEDITKGSHKIIWWICKVCAYNWNTRLADRAIKENGCPYCNNRVVDDKNNLTITHPILCQDWDYIKNEKSPGNYKSGSNNKVWWICLKCGYNWEALICNRALQNKKCPCCVGKVASRDYNLYIDNPFLCEEWNNKNEKLPTDYTPKSNSKVWWKCRFCEYEWYSAISDRNRLDSRGCPNCSKSVGENRVRYAFEYIFSQKFPNVRPDFLKNPITGYNLELDGFCEKLKIAFEYQSNYHNMIVSSYKMTEDDLIKRKEYDQFKRDKCIENNVKLIEIPQFSYNFRLEHLKDFIIKKCIELNIILPSNIADIVLDFNLVR